MKKLAVVLALSGLASACVTTRAQQPATRPPLDVPPVPPRVIEPAPPQPTPLLPEPVDQLPPPPTTTAKPRPQPRETTAREPQKPESKPPEAQTEQTPTSGQPAPPTSVVPPLRTARSGDGAQAERQIRDTLGRANGMLARVDYGKLTTGQKRAYDQAKQFIEGSEAALKDANLEAAREMADKAETYAKQLQG